MKNNNIKIAKELIKIAKELMADKDENNDECIEIIDDVNKALKDFKSGKDIPDNLQNDILDYVKDNFNIVASKVAQKDVKKVYDGFLQKLSNATGSLTTFVAIAAAVLTMKATNCSAGELTPFVKDNNGGYIVKDGYNVNKGGKIWSNDKGQQFVTVESLHPSTMPKVYADKFSNQGCYMNAMAEVKKELGGNFSLRIKETEVKKTGNSQTRISTYQVIQK